MLIKNGNNHFTVNGFNFVHNMIYLSEVHQPLGNSTLLIQELFSDYQNFNYHTRFKIQLLTATFIKEETILKITKY